MSNLQNKINRYRAGCLTSAGMSFDEKCKIYRELFLQNDNESKT